MFRKFKVIVSFGSVRDIKIHAYTLANLTPAELYDYDLQVLDDWLGILVEHDFIKHDEQMKMLAWQTAYLMNATGNFKKNILPSDIYISPLDDETEDVETLDTEEAYIQRKQLETELLATFGK